MRNGLAKRYNVFTILFKTLSQKEQTELINILVYKYLSLCGVIVYVQTLIIYYFQVSVIFKNLMLRLGFNKFHAQGGDWGSIITSYLGSLFPDKYVLCVMILISRQDLT